MARIVFQMTEGRFHRWLREGNEVFSLPSESLYSPHPNHPNYKLSEEIRSIVGGPLERISFIKTTTKESRSLGICLEDYVVKMARNPSYVVVRLGNLPRSPLQSILPILESEDSLGFVRAIKQNPDDYAPRSIYADWLDGKADGLPMNDGRIPPLRWRAAWFRQEKEKAKIDPIDVHHYFNGHYGENQKVCGSQLLFFAQMLALGFDIVHTESRNSDIPFLCPALEKWFLHLDFHDNGAMQWPLKEHLNEPRSIAPLCGETIPVLYNFRESSKTWLNISKVLRVNPFRYQIPFMELGGKIFPLINRVGQQNSHESCYYFVETMFWASRPSLTYQQMEELGHFVQHEKHTYKAPRWAQNLVESATRNLLEDMGIEEPYPIRYFRTFEEGLIFLDKLSQMALPQAQI